jgi:hypothetical protein
MDLLDRYLNAVRSFLPQAQRDDITTELAANLQAQMEDRAAELGRPLSEAEQEAILQEHGHPMLVAGRYQTSQGSLVFGRQLIGPTLFPFYLKTLWLVMGVSLAIYALVLVALALTGTPVTVGGVLTTVVFQLAIQFAIITGIFTIVERSLPTMRWDVRHPDSLHGILRQEPRERQERQERQEQVRPRLEAIAEIGGIAVFSAWLWLLFTRPAIFLGPAAATYQLEPVWRQIALPIALILVVSLAQAVLTLLRPAWAPRFRPLVRLAVDLGVLGILGYLLQAGPWVALVHPTSADGATLATINDYVFYVLLFITAGAVIAILMDAWKLVRGARSQPAPHPA